MVNVTVCGLPGCTADPTVIVKSDQWAGQRTVCDKHAEDARRRFDAEVVQDV